MTRVVACWLAVVGILVLGSRESTAQLGSGVPDTDNATPVASVDSARVIGMERLIRRRLATPVSFQVDSVTLDQTLDIFRARFGLNINFDTKAMQLDGAFPDEPVELHVQNEMARTALERLLHKRDLAWVATENGLLITTKSAADQRLETRVYPVADLVAVRTPEGLRPDFDSLIDLIKNIVMPTTWSDVGGQSAISRFAPALSLIVNQTQAGHEQLENLLGALRTSRDWQRIAHDAPVPADTVTTNFFKPPVSNPVSTPSPSYDRTHLLPPRHQGAIAPHSGGGYFNVTRAAAK